MFYIKTKLPDGKMVKTDVTDENVFTHCPECGKEISIDLAELFSDGNGDLYSSAVICEGCMAKRIKKYKHLKDINITADALALLSEVLIEAGYGEEIHVILAGFELDDLKYLPEEQYFEFATALSDLATGEYGL
jgi:hypothetical protein